jgi:hypothetical protein
VVTVRGLIGVARLRSTVHLIGRNLSGAVAIAFAAARSAERAIAALVAIPRTVDPSAQLLAAAGNG